MGEGTRSFDDLPAFLGRHLSPRTRFFELPEPLALESGGRLERVRIAYRTWGDEIDPAAHAQMRDACRVPSA